MMNTLVTMAVVGSSVAVAVMQPVVENAVIESLVVYEADTVLEERPLDSAGVSVVAVPLNKSCIRNGADVGVSEGYAESGGVVGDVLVGSGGVGVAVAPEAIMVARGLMASTGLAVLPDSGYVLKLNDVDVCAHAPVDDSSVVG